MCILKSLVPAAVIACGSFAAFPAHAVEAVVTPLMTKALADLPGKEAVMITVEYPPGSVDPVHRHDAHAFIYVLEGSNDVHVVGRNASMTKPAKFVVVFIKKQGAPILTPTPQ
jgi:hypothetical protein